MPLLNDASSIFLGEQPVTAVYQGDVKVWPRPGAGGAYAMWWDFSRDTAAGWTCSHFGDVGGYPVSVADGALVADFTPTAGGVIGPTSPVVPVDGSTFDCSYVVPYARYMISRSTTAEGEPTNTHLTMMLIDGDILTSNEYGQSSIPNGTMTVAPDLGVSDNPHGFMQSWARDNGQPFFTKEELAGAGILNLQLSVSELSVNGYLVPLTIRIAEIGLIDADMYFDGSRTVRPVGIVGGA